MKATKLAIRFRFFFFAAFFLIFTFLYSQSIDAGLYETWKYKLYWTVSPVTPLASYQVRVTLTPSNFSYANAVSDGRDIRFTDTAGNDLSYWIESWNFGGTSTVWVNAANAGTSGFWMYYGNSSVTTASNGRNTMFIYEDMSVAPAGTLNGPAIFVSGQYVELTQAVGGQIGWLNYNANPGDGFVATFDLWAGGGNGADAIWLYGYETSTGGWEDSAQGGYHFAYDEYQGDGNGPNALQLLYNGSLLTYTSLNGFGLQIDNSQWHSARIEHSGTSIKMYFDNVLYVNYSDSARSKAGNLFGWGGRTGGSTNYHRIRNMVVRKYTLSEPAATAGSQVPINGPLVLFGSVLWLDAGDATSLVLSGSNVTQWKDKSGLANNALLGVSPLYVAKANNQLPAVRFNGSTQFLDIPYSASLNNPQFSLFVVCNVRNLASTAYGSPFTSRMALPDQGFNLYAHDTGAGRQWEFWIGDGGNWVTPAGTSVILNKMTEISAIYQSGSPQQSLYQDNVLTATGAGLMVVQTSRPSRVGAGASENATPSFYFGGDIAEILLFNRVLSTGERQQVQVYLYAKWWGQNAPFFGTSF